MPSNHQLDFAPPLDWQEFQRMTCDLFRKIWSDPHAQENGRLGQEQNGVDVFGNNGVEKLVEGVQCKLTKNLTAKEVKEEYKKSRSFQPKLSRFIIVTTAKRDTKNQQAARELTQSGDYPCIVMSWDDFLAKMADYPELIDKHYPQRVFVRSEGDGVSKLVTLDVDTDHFKLMVTVIPERVHHYGGTILVSDLLSRKCETYRLGGHYSRLEGVVGNRWRAFVVSTWLNRYTCSGELLGLEREVVSFVLSEEERREGRGEGLIL